jgi:hypothetical protein
MNSQNGPDNQVERKPVEFKELAVTESLLILEMSQVHGGNGATPAPGAIGGGWPAYGYGAPAAVGRGLGIVC